ncbi:hypothetical protein Tco_1292651 [Tanacetum coccineum]
MSLPEDHLAKFHKMTDAKDMWDAIKFRFGGNDELKKMHKYILKQQFEGFSVSNSEGFHKGYDRFQSLLSQLEIHGAGVSTEDANQKFLSLTFLPWSQVSPQNVAFVSSESTSSTNDVSTAYGVSTSSGYNSQREKISSYTDKVMDLKWYIVAMISIEIEECFYKKSGGRGKLHFDAKGNLIKRDTLDYNSKIMEGALENREEPKNLGSGHWNVTFVRKNGLSKLLKQADESKEKLELGMGDQYMMHVVVSPSNDEGKIIAFWNWNREVSNSSVETLEYVPEPVVVEPKVVSQPKVWSDGPIIEEYELDKCKKTPRGKTVKEQNTYSPSPKANKRDWNGLMSKRLVLGYGFTKKACFVCGSFSHLIRDCDFHEKRMAKEVELNKKKGKGTGQGENRPVWNNVQRLNHQNQFVPTTVLTRTGRILVNIASHNFNSQAVSTSAARKVNAVRPIMNENRPRNNFHKTHSPIRRPFNRTTTF